MRMISFAVKPAKAEENIVQTIFALFLLMLCIYLMIGMPVWAQLIKGQNVVSPGILYEPVVEFIQSKL